MPQSEGPPEKPAGLRFALWSILPSMAAQLLDDHGVCV